MPVQQQAAITLTLMAEMSYEEAATLMGCKAETVRSHCKLARKAMHNMLG